MKYIKIIIVQSFLIILLLFLSLSLYFKYETTVRHINSVFIILRNIWHSAYKSFLSFLTDVRIEYNDITELFDARELAILVWFFALLFFLLISNKFRKHVIAVFKAFTDIKLMRIWTGVAVYTWIVILVLIYVGFWDVSLLKLSILWFVTVGLTTTYRAFEKIKDVGYIGYVIKDNIKYTVLIEFVGSLYTFDFLIEFFLLPFLVFLGFAISAIDTHNEGNIESLVKLKVIMQVFIGIIGLSIIYHSLKLLIDSRMNVDYIGMGKELLLPIVLSISLVIYNYYWVLRAQYQLIDIRLSSKKTIDDRYRWFLYIRIRMACGLNLKKIRTFIMVSGILTNPITSYEDVNKTIERFKHNWASAESIT